MGAVSGGDVSSGRGPPETVAKLLSAARSSGSGVLAESLKVGVKVGMPFLVREFIGVLRAERR